MKLHWSGAVLALSLASFSLVSVAGAVETPKPMVTGLKNPESVCYGPKGLIYVTEIGEFDKDGDGKVSVIEGGKAAPFATGLDDPKGIVFYKNSLYVTDKTKVVKIDAKGQTSVYLDADKFPNKPQFLNDIAVDVGNGIFLVSDSGDLKGKLGAVYRIDVRLNKIETVVDTKSIPDLHSPNGVTFDGAAHILVADFGPGALYRVKLADRSAEKLAEGMEGADGLVWDHFGRLFITSWKTGKVFGIPRPGQKPIQIGEGLASAADSCLEEGGRDLLIPDMNAGTLTKLSTKIAGWEVDESPLPVELTLAFPKLKWTGWGDDDSGVVVPLRPILLTHAGDGTNNVYVPIQQGVVHVFDNDDKTTETKIFLDISKKVRYSDKQNEEGFLGLAFHPKFKENGEFFVYYTDVNAKMTNVLSRFRTKKDDRTVADPASEEQLIRFDRPFWNHDGGTLVFGPDGYLYIVVGDGGSGGDPFNNGQNLGTLFGKVLRIDVDKKTKDRPYGIPADNPFVKQAEAKPEIWAYGIRNIWRMALDKKTGQFWAGEVGQNLYEEIILLKSGGNYGWSLRESLHPFGDKGVGLRKDMEEPIWEYSHDLGKSITGGHVYRGKDIPELEGLYLYADYVTNKLWALRYDEQKGRVVANHPLSAPAMPVLSFGEDNKGEAYLMGVSPTGKGIYRFTRAAKTAAK